MRISFRQYLSDYPATSLTQGYVRVGVIMAVEEMKRREYQELAKDHYFMSFGAGDGITRKVGNSIFPEYGLVKSTRDKRMVEFLARKINLVINCCNAESANVTTNVGCDIARSQLMIE